MQYTDLAIVDIQFVIGNKNEYYVKEMAILDLTSNKEENYIFKSKFHYSKLTTQARYQNKFNYKHINGLLWRDGQINYNEIFGILQKISEKTIILRGIEKKTHTTVSLTENNNNGFGNE